MPAIFRQLPHFWWYDDCLRYGNASQEVKDDRSTDSRPGAGAVIDESDHPKKGNKTACVDRDYCGASASAWRNSAVASRRDGDSVVGLVSCDDQHSLIVFFVRAEHVRRFRVRVPLGPT